jgi:long-chain fatty acid transport protein
MKPGTTLRAGYVTLDQPIPASQTFFNILAPGVVEDHLTLGLTVATSKTGELTVMYMHAFENEVNGSNSIPAGFGGGNANLRMSQDSLGVAYGWKY